MSAYARIRIKFSLRICLECRNKSKNRDKQLTFIVRVIASALYSVKLEVVFNLSFKLIIDGAYFSKRFKSLGSNFDIWLLIVHANNINLD